MELSLKISLVSESGEATAAGQLHVLGGEKEMPWAYERLMKLDVTEAFKTSGINPDHAVKVPCCFISQP